MAEMKVERVISNGIQNVVILKIQDGGKIVYVPVQGYNTSYSAEDIARRMVRGY